MDAKFFAEPFPTLTRPYAQRSIPLQEALCQIGMALGGQAGARLGDELGISASRDTILRLLRATDPPATLAPKKVGIDDWAWKRGHRYGTLLCDLERGMPIDLLPDRSMETVTAWFQHHPTLELISRDRASDYAAAASKGAPQAVQVADRWHVMVRRIGADWIPFGERRGGEQKTSEAVAYFAGKPNEDSSMRQRQTCPKAFTAGSACLVRHGEAELPNLTSNGESHARRCR